MKYCLITFRTVTPAQQAENLLRRNGFTCSLQRTPRRLEEQGCGYSLRIRCEDLYPGLDFLENHGVAYKKAYTLEKNGAVEELLL